MAPEPNRRSAARPARRSTAPLKLRIAERGAEDPDRRFSAVVLSREWAAPLRNVSYPVDALRGEGLLKRAGQRRRRATQRYHRVALELLV